jgi:hypothetical protein
MDSMTLAEDDPLAKYLAIVMAKKADHPREAGAAALGIEAPASDGGGRYARTRSPVPAGSNAQALLMAAGGYSNDSFEQVEMGISGGRSAGPSHRSGRGVEGGEAAVARAWCASPPGAWRVAADQSVASVAEELALVGDRR